MPRYLDQDYDQEGRPTGLIPHFWDTLAAIGGVYGIIFIFVAIIAFFNLVEWYISYSRKKREAAKKRR